MRDQSPLPSTSRGDAEEQSSVATSLMPLMLTGYAGTSEGRVSCSDDALCSEGVRHEACADLG